MRALVCREFGTPEKLVIEERDEPRPGPGEVKIKVRAAALNFPDLLIIGGQYQVRLPPPFVPGGEAAGVVTEVGAGVTRFRPGERVIATPGTGAFAEQIVVPEALCLPMPASMDFEQGAGFTVTYATSYHAFRQSTALQAGETVLVLGAAGGVGSSAIEIARALGARVIAAASSAGKLAFAREVGADEGIDYSTGSLREAVKELTGGAGADVVYDPVGGPLAEQAYRALAWQGRYLVIGFASGEIPSFAANIALLKEAAVIGVWWGTWSKQHPVEARRNMSELFGMVEDGRLRPRVTGRYPLERFAEAFATIAGRRARGKIVLCPGD